MSVTSAMLEAWLVIPAEAEKLDFKEAKNSFSRDKILEYTVALANEGGGHLVLGVTDKPPRQVVGTSAFSTIKELNEIKKRILDKLHVKVEVEEVFYSSKRVLVFVIPSRPPNTPIHLDGFYLMRSGESLVPMTPDQLKKIINEIVPSWLESLAVQDLTPGQVVNLINVQEIFELLHLPSTDNEQLVIERLSSIGFIRQTSTGVNITNLGAILGARKLSSFPEHIALRAPRLIRYSGISKDFSSTEYDLDQGLAVGFAEFLDRSFLAGPEIELLEEDVRDEKAVFPRKSLRELIANAFVHQDFEGTSERVRVEVYDNRVEISNPGLPSIDVFRFIDDEKSRNARMADFMRKIGVCEAKGSGVDKVVSIAEALQRPAPEFLVETSRTRVIMYAPKNFAQMTRDDRIRACYQHCVLRYVTRSPMTNQSLRGRFGLDSKASSQITDIINATKDQGFIVQKVGASSSTRFAEYVPLWAASQQQPIQTVPQSASEQIPKP